MIKVNLMGRLTKDAVIVTKEDFTVCKFSLACDGKYHKGETQTMFFDCSIFGKRAEYLGKYAQKGDKLYVTGDLTQREYEGRLYYQVDINDFEFVGTNHKAENNAENNAEKVQSVATELPLGEEELPF